MALAFYLGVIPRHNVAFKVKRALGPSLSGTQAAVL